MGNGAFNTIFLVWEILQLKKYILVKQPDCGTVDMSQGTLLSDSPAFSKSVILAQEHAALEEQQTVQDKYGHSLCL